MAKAVRGFYGSLSNGQPVEAAESVSGTWFRRFYGFNGHGMGWSKWAEFTPVWDTKAVNLYDGTVEDIPEGVRMSAGYGSMREIKGKLNYRLPS